MTVRGSALQSKREQNKIEDYLNNYVLPLIGVPFVDVSKIKYVDDFDYNNDDIGPNNFLINENKVTMLIPAKNSLDREPFISFSLPDYVDSDSKLLLDRCIMSFYKHCFNRNIASFSEKREITLFRYSIDNAICAWISGQSNHTIKQLEKLMLILENWSVKTYEGHKVNFAFLFDPSPVKESISVDRTKIGSFLDFIDSEYGAVFTDGITSIIEVDSNCEFVKYHSITEDNILEECNLSTSVPYRFTQVISEYVSKEKIGLFLLNNGDLIIAKNGEIYFVKRNNKWLNFRNPLFKRIIKEKHPNISDELIESVFVSALDVSFAHNGGIISVVDINSDSWDRDVTKHINNNDNQSLLHEIDLFDNYSKIENEKLYALFDKTLKNDTFGLGLGDYEISRKIRSIRKRITKRKYIHEIITNKQKSDSLFFNQLDRRLKVESIGLDGACILNTDGRIISFGAIIKNDAGSSEGGRGAAAKKLSNYGGFAIKISTDGYIEVFADGDNVYSIK